MASAKPFPLNARISIGKDSQGGDVFASKDLLDQINGIWSFIGGYQATSNGDLLGKVTEITDSARLGVFARPLPQQKTVNPGNYILVGLDAGGYTVGLDFNQLIGQVIASVVPFLPKPSQPPAQRPVNDADAIISARVFGAH